MGDAEGESVLSGNDEVGVCGMGVGVAAVGVPVADEGCGVVGGIALGVTFASGVGVEPTVTKGDCDGRAWEGVEGAGDGDVSGVETRPVEDTVGPGEDVASTPMVGVGGVPPVTTGVMSAALHATRHTTPAIQTNRQLKLRLPVPAPQSHGSPALQRSITRSKHRPT